MHKNSLLKYQIFSSLFFAIQYLCLGAINGCLMNLMTMIRNVIYKKMKKTPFYIVLMIALVVLRLSLFAYDGLISLLPSIAVIMYTFAVWQKKLTITRIVEVISCILFIIYNVKVLAIIGLISTIIEMTFALIAIYRFDIKKKK